MTVKQIAAELKLWGQITKAVENSLIDISSAEFLAQIGAIPIKKSWATCRLGAYVTMGDKPLCIRLQMAQEPENLKQTLLHEVAHACDHLSNHNRNKRPRLIHGPGWKAWAISLGIAPQRCGESAALKQLHHERLKLVARCKKCGAEINRLRRLNKNRTYIHNNCGGKLERF